MYDFMVSGAYNPIKDLSQLFANSEDLLLVVLCCAPTDSRCVKKSTVPSSAGSDVIL